MSADEVRYVRDGHVATVTIDRPAVLNAVDDKSAGHAAEYLIVDEAVGVRVVPEQAGTLPAGRRDPHLVLECFAGVNVDEDVVTLALRRHAHAVIVQVRRLIRQVVAEGDPHGIAEARS